MVWEGHRKAPTKGNSGIPLQSALNADATQTGADDSCTTATGEGQVWVSRHADKAPQGGRECCKIHL